MRRFLLLVFLGVGYIGLQAQSVIRGPYMQSPNHESIIVMWRTDAPTSTRVWYGTDSLNLNLSEEINDNVEDHIIKLTGLQASTHYYYAVGDINTQLANDLSLQHFTTHPTPGEAVPTRIWAIGDFGRGNTGQVDVKNVYENYTGTRGTDVWLWLGDNAYNDGEDNEYQTKLFDVPGFSDMFLHTPFWPSPGNHDYNTVWSESTLLGIPYSNIGLTEHEGPYFDMVEVPQHAECGGFPSQHEVFYSFDYGDVHFLSLNSEVFDYTFSYDGINEMKTWIENDLQQNTRKFTMAYFHQPPYSKGSHDSDDLYELVMKAMRERVIPLLEDYDIDLVICGHSHVFERSFLINGHYDNSSSFDPNTMIVNNTSGSFANGIPYLKDDSYATQEGTVYVVCGNSGSSESSPSLNYPAMYYSDGGSGAMGSFVIDVHKNRLDGKYLKVTGVVEDEFTILKQDMYALPLSDYTICQGDSINVAALYTGGSDDISFSWSNTVLTDSAVFLKPQSTTQYTLTITDDLTGQIVTEDFTINVNAIVQPVVQELIEGITLGADVTGYDYQWYIGNNPINGANGQYYEPDVDGTYYVAITDINGCTILSEAFEFEKIDNPPPTSIQELEEGVAMLYPNPTTEKITLDIDGGVQGESYTIADVSGKIVRVGKTKGKSTSIELNDLASGLYFLNLHSHLGHIQLTFIKE